MLFSKNKTPEQKQKIANIQCSIGIVFLLGFTISSLFINPIILKNKENILLSTQQTQQVQYNFNKMKASIIPATKHASDIKNNIINTFNFEGQEIFPFLIFFKATSFTSSNPENIDATFIIRSHDYLKFLGEHNTKNFNNDEIKNIYKQSYQMTTSQSFIDSEKLMNSHFVKNIEKYQDIIKQAKEQNNWDKNLKIAINESTFVRQMTNLYFYSLLLNDENIDLYKYSQVIVNDDKFQDKPHIILNYQLHNLTVNDKDFIENIYNSFYKDKFGEELHPYFKELIRFRESQDKTLKEKGDVTMSDYFNLKDYEIPISEENLEKIKAQFDKITKNN